MTVNRLPSPPHSVSASNAAQIIQDTLLRDRKKGWQKRAQRWKEGRQLMDALLFDSAIPGHACTAWLDWADDFLEPIGMTIPSSMVSAYARGYLGAIHNLVHQENGEEVAHHPSTAGRAERAGMIAATLTDLLLNAEPLSEDISQEGVWPKNLIKLLDDCINGRLTDSDAHANVGRLLYKMSKNDSGRAFLIDDSNLGFARIGSMLYRSDSAGISTYLLLALQNLLPKPSRGKGSPRTIALHCALKGQGWEVDVLRDSFFAIGRVTKAMVPQQLMHCVNIFSKDPKRSRPQGFQVTSLSVDGEDQLTSAMSKRYLEQGDIICYLDRLGWRFSYYDDDELEGFHTYALGNTTSFEHSCASDSFSLLSRSSHSENTTIEFSVLSSQTDDLLQTAKTLMGMLISFIHFAYRKQTNTNSPKIAGQGQEGPGEQDTESYPLPLKPVTPSTRTSKTYGSKGSGNRRARKFASNLVDDLTSECAQGPASASTPKPAPKSRATAKGAAKGNVKSVPPLNPTALKSRARYTLAKSIAEGKAATPSSCQTAATRRQMQSMDVGTSEMEEEDEQVSRPAKSLTKKHKESPLLPAIKDFNSDRLTYCDVGPRDASRSPSLSPAQTGKGKRLKPAPKRPHKPLAPQSSSQPGTDEEEDNLPTTSDQELDSSFDHSPKRAKMAGKTPYPKKARSYSAQRRRESTGAGKSVRGKGKGKMEEEGELTVPEMLSKIAPIVRKRVTRAQGRKV